VPNDYLFETHANKGKDKWEIYAWAIREVMTTAGDIEKDDSQYREKLQYESLLGFRKPPKVTASEKEPLIEVD
jgi:hypothetical protein